MASITPEALDRGCAAYAEGRWAAAFDGFTDADRDFGLSAPDLECLSTAAVLVGDGTAAVDALTRAHEAYRAAGHIIDAARSAAWIGMHLMNHGDRARSAGWFARAGRLVHDAPRRHPWPASC
jgi:hypothetical protein